MNRVERFVDLALSGEPAILVLAGSRNQTSTQAALAATQKGLTRLFVVHESVDHPVDPVLVDMADEIIQTSNEEECCIRAVEIAASESNTILLKGSTHSDVLLRFVIRHMRGHKNRGILSDTMLLNDPFPSHNSGLLGIADGGILTLPSTEQKIEICRNAVQVFHAVGVKRPRVALLSATESVTPSLPSSMEALAVKEAIQKSTDFPACIVDGPLAFDLAKVPQALASKGLESPLQGQADILVVPNVESGNMLAKALYWLGSKPVAHVASGAGWPVLIPSRSEDEDSKLASIALAVLASQKTNKPSLQVI